MDNIKPIFNHSKDTHPNNPIFKHCAHNHPHLANKLWIPIKTLNIKRDGFGSEIKTALMRCKKCGEIKERTISFFDRRVKFK